MKSKNEYFNQTMNTVRATHAYLILVLALINTIGGYCQQEEIYKLPSGPEGPGSFGAYYTHLKYDPEWDHSWRVADHPDVVVRFEDGGHRFVFWRGTSYIPCWVTDNGIWYTNEFVERRGIHSANTDGCVEPMSDKQCRYSHVRIIESNDARVVVHWRYAPIDVAYEHPFLDELTGWFDWVDEYYVIYPDATGIRTITVHSSGLSKWVEYQEGIVVNQPGTLPHENIEKGAVSVANMKGEHKTYYWDEDGSPAFDENPPGANILRINLKSSRKPFALVPPPLDDYNMISLYRGHGRNSIFNWWDHWPVSQEASDGRSARSADRPSHSSLCHIALQVDPPVDCWGSKGYGSVIRAGLLEWTVTEWSGLNLIFEDPTEMKDSVLISFDYGNLWSPDISLSFFDTGGGSTEEISLGDVQNELVLNHPALRSFKKMVYLPDYAGDADLSEISEVYFEVSGSEEQRTLKLDNINISNQASVQGALNYFLDFELPDGSSIEEINNIKNAGWEPYAEGENTITKLMLHGMTEKKVQDLVPLAKSWSSPAEIKLTGDEFENLGYDPAQLAYVMERKSKQAQSLVMELEANKDSPLVNPAFLIRNWGASSVKIYIDGNSRKEVEEFRAGYVETLSGTDLVLWVKIRTEETVRFIIEPLKTKP